MAFASCRRASTAVSADTDTRWSSSTQRICSSVAPGIISDVNTRRKAESGRAHPTRIIASKVACISSCSGVGSRNWAA